ncbi:hypothetical protein Q9L58_001946 [Maublancomyces gigas]|uniref:Uncharacterized protein n=1 Tax=Discina gigas TaxID=1032678 RepID=A0ABR3GSZ4_9PEZI
MIEVQQIQIILTGCMLTFSELRAAIDSLGQRSTLRGRMRWVLAESTITELVQRLRDHKSSLTLIWTVLTCQSTLEAVNSIAEHRVREHFIERNSQLYNHVREPEAQSPIQQRDSTTSESIRRWTSSRLTIETVLTNSRIYWSASARPPPGDVYEPRTDMHLCGCLSRMRLCETMSLATTLPAGTMW